MAAEQTKVAKGAIKTHTLQVLPWYCICSV